MDVITVTVNSSIPPDVTLFHQPLHYCSQEFHWTFQLRLILKLLAHYWEFTKFYARERVTKFFSP